MKEPPQAGTGIRNSKTGNRITRNLPVEHKKAARQRNKAGKAVSHRALQIVCGVVEPDDDMTLNEAWERLKVLPRSQPLRKVCDRVWRELTEERNREIEREIAIIDRDGQRKHHVEGVKERALGDHLDEDGSHGPDVDGGCVGGASEENFGGAVPEGNDLVGEGANWRAEGAGEAKVGEFQAAVSGY